MDIANMQDPVARDSKHISNPFKPTPAVQSKDSALTEEHTWPLHNEVSLQPCSLKPHRPT